MIDDVLRQNWSTLHSPLMDLFPKQTVTGSSPRGVSKRELGDSSEHETNGSRSGTDE